MDEIKLIPATSNDIEQISQLATVIWNQYYPNIIGQTQVDYMLGKMYSRASLQEQLEVKKHQFYLIQFKSNNVGFISVNEDNKGEWFLNKFYINQTLSAKGIGSKTFEEVLKIIRPNKITLTVNRGNYKSINFYFKMRFRIKETAVFDIGNGFVMDDFVMCWIK